MFAVPDQKFTKRDLAAEVLFLAKPLQHGPIKSISTAWIDIKFPDADPSDKARFVKTFTNAMVDKTKKLADKSGFLTFHKHQNFLNQPINLQHNGSSPPKVQDSSSPPKDQDCPSPPEEVVGPTPPKVRRNSVDPVEFARQAEEFFKPKSEEAL